VDRQIEDLEFKLAHLERAIQELSEVLFRQQRQLDVLEERYARLLDRLDAADRQATSASQFEIPPHY
jgi:uncharacterized coiled-coil protein SlyX